MKGIPPLTRTITMWDSLQKILPSVAGKYNFSRSMQATRICQEYRSLAPKLVKPDALTHTFPKSYEKQILTVGVINSAWAQQVQMNSHTLLMEINKKYGSQTVTKLRVEMVDSMPGFESAFKEEMERENPQGKAAPREHFRPSSVQLDNKR